MPFSFTTDPAGLKNKVSCYVAYTNETTHKIILDNLDRSPLYGEAKRIQGVGPRYCPSIEDKVVRFSDKKRHQLFIEPMGLDTQEMYLQGMSSSLPEDVQLAFLHSIHGLEKVEVMRNAYAIEYDCCDAQQLKATLEFKPFCRGCTAPVSSTALPVTRKPPLRGWWLESTPPCRCWAGNRW